VTYPAGSAPSSVATGDFNGDGKLDLAVAGNGAILLGNGDGTFMPAALGTFAGYWVTTGDLNGDGKLDLAVAGSCDVDILLGNGDGTFMPPVIYTSGIVCGFGGLVSIATGDFNVDANLDIAVVANGDGVNMLLGNGDGTLMPPSYFSAGTKPWSIATGDINGDGKLDFAVADSDTTCDVSILLGSGDGGVMSLMTAVSYGAACPPSSDVPSVTTGDFNEDGKLDLAVSNGFSKKVSVLIGNGDGTFKSAVNYAPGWSFSVTTGDFNGDGHVDLAVAGGGGEASLLQGAGDGTFATGWTFGAAGTPVAIATGDFNADGKLDLVVADHSAGYVAVFVNTTCP
jgi:hypothetical protein